MNHEQHSHVPYLVLLMKALYKWRESRQNSNDFPQNLNDRKEFKQVLLDMRLADEKGKATGAFLMTFK